MPSTLTIGLDGTPRGWVAITLNDQGFVEAFFAKSFAEHLEHCADAHTIAVDIPMGLSDSGHRKADLNVRGVLKGRASSLFVTPPRPALEAESYADEHPKAYFEVGLYKSPPCTKIGSTRTGLLSGCMK